MPYFVYVSFCKNVRPVNTSGHAIFLSGIHCDEALSNCKNKKGNNSYDRVRLSFGTNLLKTKLNHITGSPISSYSTCSSPLYFDLFVIFIHFPYKFYFFILQCPLLLDSFIYQANCFSNFALPFKLTSNSASTGRNCVADLFYPNPGYNCTKQILITNHYLLL